MNPVTGKGNRYCGPAALSIVTGLPVDQCAYALRQVSGKKYIFGVANYHLLAALQGLGHDSRLFSAPDPKPTLAEWCRNRKEPNKTYILNITGHYIVIRNNRGCDNRSKVPKPLKEFGYRRCRVKTFIELTGRDLPKKISTVRPKVSDHARAEQKARIRAKKLLVQHPHLSVDLSDWRINKYIWVYNLRLNSETDPYDGNHIVRSWGEALERLQSYLDHKPGEAA